MELEDYTCRVPGCDGPRSGVCINGLSFEECPDVIPFESEVQQEYPKVNADATHADVKMVSTGGVSSLDATACDSLLRERGGTLVGVVAGPNVGKTTMICTIYELIHRGRMQVFKFAGSETLRGYEERCHLARMASMGGFSETPRTKISFHSYTHLRVSTPSGIKDVIFSDRSGEHFDNILNSPADIGSFAELKRADIILLLIDLELLLKAPHQPKSQVRRLFLAMDQSTLLNDKTLILVGTKADLTNPDDSQSEAITAIEELGDHLKRRALSNVKVNTHLVASRARSGSNALGDGLEELLQTILTERDPPEFSAGKAWPKKLTELDALMHQYRNRKI